MIINPEYPGVPQVQQDPNHGLTALEKQWANESALAPRPAVGAPNPMSMIQLAVQQNCDLNKLEKLMELQERWEKNEARKAFVSAMAAFKAEPMVIIKNKTVQYGAGSGRVEYDHASLDNVCATIDPALSKHGLSYRWQTEQIEEKIKVTCFLQHRQGHTESVSLESLPDKSGSKNAIQAIGSATHYLERYTLLAITGKATTDQDDDGRATGQQEEPLSSLDNLAERIDWINNCRDLEELKSIYTTAYRDANKLHDNDSIKALTKAKDARRAELTKEAR